MNHELDNFTLVISRKQSAKKDKKFYLKSTFLALFCVKAYNILQMLDWQVKRELDNFTLVISRKQSAKERQEILPKKYIFSTVLCKK